MRRFSPWHTWGTFSERFWACSWACETLRQSRAQVKPIPSAESLTAACAIGPKLAENRVSEIQAQIPLGIPVSHVALHTLVKFQGECFPESCRLFEGRG